jgi:hypothetical protein
MPPTAEATAPTTAPTGPSPVLVGPGLAGGDCSPTGLAAWGVARGLGVGPGLAVARRLEVARGLALARGLGVALDLDVARGLGPLAADPAPAFFVVARGFARLGAGGLGLAGAVGLVARLALRCPGRERGRFSSTPSPSVMKAAV